MENLKLTSFVFIMLLIFTSITLLGFEIFQTREYEYEFVKGHEKGNTKDTYSKSGWITDV